MPALYIGLVGALGGGLISMLTSVLTLRSSQHSERERWMADRQWEYATGLVSIRRETYAQFLAQLNAVIMTAGSTMTKVQAGHTKLDHMPADQAGVYQAEQDAWAHSLLLAGPALRDLLNEAQNYVSELVWASWQGQPAEQRGGLYEDILAAMKVETVEPPRI